MEGGRVSIPRISASVKSLDTLLRIEALLQAILHHMLPDEAKPTYDHPVDYTQKDGKPTRWTVDGLADVDHD